MKSIGCYVSLLTNLTLAGQLILASPLAALTAEPEAELRVKLKDSVYPEFSMQNVQVLKLRGGNYWGGYFYYSVDFQKAFIEASWDSFDLVMKTANGRMDVQDEDLRAIADAVENLQYEILRPGEDECYVMADGDETSLTLQRPGKLSVRPLYPLKSWPSRCQGQPLSNESFAKLEEIIFKILPRPSVPSAFDRRLEK